MRSFLFGTGLTWEFGKVFPRLSSPADLPMTISPSRHAMPPVSPWCIRDNEVSSIRSHLKNVFWPNFCVGFAFQLLKILQYSCGLNRSAALNLNQNPVFEIPSNMHISENFYVKMLDIIVQIEFYERLNSSFGLSPGSIDPK